MTISERDLDRWAARLLSFSLGGIKTGETVMIKGEVVAWPLIDRLQKRILKAGAFSDIFLLPPDNERGRVWGSAAAKYCTPRSLKCIPGWISDRYNSFSKYIEIYGMEHPELLSKGRPDTMRRIMELEKELTDIRLGKPWVITMFPTRAFASAEGVPYSAYERLLVEGSTVHPGAIKRIASRISRVLRRTGTLKIITAGGGGRALELNMNISGRNILDDMNGSNLPCGEVYTSPDASSVSGEIYLDMPISKQGECIEGTYLKFVSGKVVSFHSKKGQKKLAAILSTDAGSGRLGEVAFGINPMLKRPLMHPLFCEKLSGTMHIALGQCFPKAFVLNPSCAAGIDEYRGLLQAGVANTSAQHVDLVVSFRPGGSGRAVFLDGRPMKIRNGNWAVY